MLRALIPIFDALRSPVLAFPLLISYGTALDAVIHSYSGELGVLARQLARVTSYTYGGVPALRITGTLGVRRRSRSLSGPRPGSEGSTRC